MDDEHLFSGAKLALLSNGLILVYKRDAKPEIDYPGYWDLPGGGREGNETPQNCALRELSEEFSLLFSGDRIKWMQSYPSLKPGRSQAWFLVGCITQEEISSIRFGDEGQYWTMMEIEKFLNHPMAVPYLKTRLIDYLSTAITPDC
ncbi:NUDIX domain-containing protein [Serratia marcescens]|nr:NUDIX domain-containing protein [Serratia marcescens]